MHPLRHKIGLLRSRLRQLLLLYGMSATVAAVVVAAMVLGTADYWLRLRDPGVRIFSSLGLLAVLGWVAYHCLWLPLATRLADAELALHLKRRFPELGDQLASSLEFLDQPDDEPTAGSPALRHAVIERTWGQARQLEFRTALDSRAAFRAAGMSLIACLAAAILIAIDPASSRIAVARLANPVDPPAWPRHTHLELRNAVHRLARGQAFEVEVVDRTGARLPDDLQIEYRVPLPDGATTLQREPMRRRSTTVAFARRESVTRPFAYRAVGGDDDSMPWLEVEVAEPPTVEETALRLTPPGYTNYPSHLGEKHLRLLVGTTLAISGRVNKPLRSLMLHLGEQPPIPAALDREGTRFRIPASGQAEPVINAANTYGPYWLELIDREGLRSETPPWELQAVPDPPPTVVVEQPSSSLFVTPGAVVPVRVAAKDNLAVRRIVLNYRVEGGLSQFSRHRGTDPPSDDRSTARMGRLPSSAAKEAAGELILFEGPARAPPPGVERPSPLDSPGDHRVAEAQWPLGPLGLQPGTQLILTATADDYQPARGESLPVRLSIITPRELEERIAARQNLILAELRRILEMQRSSRAQVAELATRLDATEQLARSDTDHLRAAELTQRRIEGDLTGRRDSVPDYVTGLLADLDNNRVDSPGVRRRMQSLLEELDRVRRDHLPPLRHALTTAIKSAQAEGGPPADTWPADPAVSQSLVTAASHQDRVIDTLEQLLEALGRWDDYRRFYREIGRMQREQEDLETRTTQTGRRTMGRDPRDLPPADVADLRVLAEAQLELARQLDRMGADMDQTASQLDTTDPLAADTIAHAVDEIRSRSLSNLMRTVGGHLELNRIGQAVEAQRNVHAALHDVLDILANRREHELERLVERLRDMETKLADIRRRQTEKAAGFRHAAQDEDDDAVDAPETRRRLESLANRQSELADETVLAARRLDRLLAHEAAHSAEQAGERMGAAVRAAAAGSAVEGAAEAGQAQELLELAHRQLEVRRRLAQAQLAAEQLARLENAAKHLYDAQQKVIDETRQLDRSVDSPDGLTRIHLADLQELVRRQLAIQSDTEQLSRKLLGAEAVQLVLHRAAASMAEVAAGLQRQQTGHPTQQAAILARDQLALLTEAFRVDTAASSQDPAGGGAGAGADEQPIGAPIAAAEVKLLKLLQQDLNRRTVEVAESVARQHPMPETLRVQLQQLAQEQGRLAELALGLLAQPAEEQRPAPKEKLP